MATAEQLAELEDAQGQEAERLYLELMIPTTRQVRPWPKPSWSAPTIPW
nr:DUF305 domain-containing protein [Kocuria rosea]